MKDYIALKLKEENHKVIMANYEQPYDKSIESQSFWNDRRPPSMVSYTKTPFDKVEIAKLFMEISQEILKLKDIEWLNIESVVDLSPTSMDTRLKIRIDLWEEELE